MDLLLVLTVDGSTFIDIPNEPRYRPPNTVATLCVRYMTFWMIGCTTVLCCALYTSLQFILPAKCDKFNGFSTVKSDACVIVYSFLACPPSKQLLHLLTDMCVK